MKKQLSSVYVNKQGILVYSGISGLYKVTGLQFVNSVMGTMLFWKLHLIKQL